MIIGLFASVMCTKGARAAEWLIGPFNFISKHSHYDQSKDAGCVPEALGQNVIVWGCLNSLYESVHACVSVTSNQLGLLMYRSKTDLI